MNVSLFLEIFHVVMHFSGLLCIIILPTEWHKLYFTLDALSGYSSINRMKSWIQYGYFYLALLVIHLWIHTHTVLYLYQIKNDFILDSVFKQQQCKFFSLQGMNESINYLNIIYIFGTIADIIFHIYNIKIIYLLKKPIY